MVGRIFPTPEKHDYPEVAALFRVARERLAAIRNESEVLDIDVGRLLSFDYKYTHQFRHGKMRFFNLRHLWILAEKVQTPAEIFIKVLRRDLTADQALEAIGNWHKAKPVELQAKDAEIEVQLSGFTQAKKPPSAQVFAKKVKELWDEAQRISESPALLNEFADTYSGGSPEDREMVERLRKPKLAMPRRSPAP